ncbi:mannose-1-phosphate guanylyltransferase [Clostridium paraputrificum]|uniref:mannose-1-phosphate guanylyltransferase n=1 Tax=Clostridium paraputrificum TaxID=29363 RepID=UPI003D33D585
MLCAVIMAGGKGTRFWPLSTEEKPKQFLNLVGSDTMIQMTVSRIEPIIPIERIFVCTGKRYVGLVKEQLPNLPERNIIIEPEGRNTAPCIALSALVIKRYYKEATMVVLPSDHLIGDENKFRDIVLSAEKFLVENKDAIVTLGMKPSRPEVGYGYIKESTCKEIINSNKVNKVESFVEKPDFETAKSYLRDERYLWNGGMFLWTVNGIIEKIKNYLPSTYEALASVENVKEEEIQDEVDRMYRYTNSISIDYGILEKAAEIFVIPSEIGWDDVGSWEALERYREKDKYGNIHIGNISSLNSENNIIIAANNQIIIDDVQDIFVIENDGKIVVGRKENINKVKTLKKIV